jgi:uncharacterized protein
MNSEIKTLQSATAACSKIAPLWSLENYVAVNPFLGFTHLPFEKAAGKLKQVGADMTMPISFYLEEMERNKITFADLENAIHKSDFQSTQAKDFVELAQKQVNETNFPQLITVVDMIEQLEDEKWSVFIVDRITSWASSYFDKGQALWNTSSKKCDLFESWLNEALVDRTPMIAGIKNFHTLLQEIPKQADEAILHCVEILQIPAGGQETYFHALLMRAGGWSSYCSGIDWDNSLYGGSIDHKKNFLAILLAWEVAILKGLPHEKIASYWVKFKEKLPVIQNSFDIDKTQQIQLCLQNAHDIAAQRALIEKLNGKSAVETHSETAIKAQAFFCIDVRSEVYRRNLELITPEIETKGFAGFFGMAIDYKPVAQTTSENQCPVLIPAGLKVKDAFDSTSDFSKVFEAKKVQQQYTKSWKSFKSGAVSGFSFVTSLGLTYIPKLITDSFGLTRPVTHPNQQGMNKTLEEQKTVELDIAFDDQVALGKGALTAMSLTSGFAPLILFIGHGSTTVNNPHATGLDCGACGGRTGEVNTKVAAKILNNPEIREALVGHGIHIPKETFFLGGLHDTTTDELIIYNQGLVPAMHANSFREIKSWFQQAGQATRTERATRFGSTAKTRTNQSVQFRSKDWSQVRPEWGLAGCDTFIIAPRSKTKKISLEGKSFLHDYTWQEDKNGAVLTAIMSAPMVVTSWINLQYYASTVDQKTFGAGNKTLHNVVGGFGVIEGHGGDLKTGLPLQSVHDGTTFQHLPSRLNVVINASLEAMNSVIASNESVRNLCDNAWIHLLAMDDEGKISHRYKGNQVWESIDDKITVSSIESEKLEQFCSELND